MFFKKIFLVFLINFQSACATSRALQGGLLYTQTQSPLLVTSQPAGSRVGESCLTSLLWLFSWGDASIETARRQGGILEMSSVDERIFQVLGPVYGQYCTIVRGR